MSIDATCPFCRNQRLEINRTNVSNRLWLHCEHCQAEFPMVRTIDDAYKLIESITVGCDRKAVVMDYLEEVK